MNPRLTNIQNLLKIMQHGRDGVTTVVGSFGL